MKRTIERRCFPVFELRAEGDETPHIRGHAAVFNQDSVPLFEWGGERLIERIEPGAFTKTIQESDIRALVNHDPNYVLGRNKAKTLELAEDKRGLAIDNTPPATTWARDLMVSMNRGDIDQMSFGFEIVKERWEREVDVDTKVVTHIRTLLEVRLWDVSVVTFPAYPDTDAQVRSLVAASGDQAPMFLRNLAQTEPPQAGHSDRGRETQARLAMARRRLTLAELE
jgi:HK97 family phage prohead protease